MKKVFIAILMAAGFYSASYAQQTGQVELGGNIGYNGSYVQETGTYNNTDATSGLNLGFSAEYYFSDRWSIKGKVNFDQKGWANGFLDLPDGSSAEGVKFRLNYITVPIMANWHFGRTRNWYLHFGPYAGFLMSAKAAGVDVKEAFNSTDFGLDLGIGIKIPVSDKAKLFFEYDGQGGVSNVFSDGGPSVQNVRESINVGFVFAIK